MTYMDPRPEGLNKEKAPESIVETLAGGWRPIGAAPKDGTHVLTWNGRWIAVSYWSAKDFYNAPAWHDTRIDINHIDQPTHWMPLPAAPTDEVKNA